MTERIGVSLDKDLLCQFDRHIQDKGYTNRSEALRDLIRGALIREEWQDTDGDGLAVVLLVYDHHARELPKRLTEAQHHRYGLIVSSTHVHVDEHNCLEILILKGLRREIKELADLLISTKGVKHGTFTPTTSGGVV